MTQDLDRPNSNGAKKKFDKLANQAADGNPEAQFYVGVAYLEGKLVDRSLEQSIRWLWAASVQGHDEARKRFFAVCSNHMLQSNRVMRESVCDIIVELSRTDQLLSCKYKSDAPCA
jgi:TPR repeat protein